MSGPPAEPGAEGLRQRTCLVAAFGHVVPPVVNCQSSQSGDWRSRDGGVTWGDTGTDGTVAGGTQVRIFVWPLDYRS